MTNDVRRRLEAGDAVLGARAAVPAPEVVEVYGDLGFDFVWLDFEHGGGSPYAAPTMESLARAADAAGVEPLVRLPHGDTPLVQKVLDAGVRTLLIPRVETADDVRRAVRATRFEYDGGPGARGVGSGRARRWGGAGADYAAEQDANVLCGVMIEHTRALSNLDSILSVPELGFVFVGPADLSVSMGRPLQTDHPDVRDAIETVREACLDAGVPVGHLTTDPADARDAIDRGAQLVRLGDELGIARRVLGDRLDAVRRGPSSRCEADRGSEVGG